MRVELERVVARHPAARQSSAAALKDVSLSVSPGELVAIIGPSGAGKTSLLHVAAGALKPRAGAVTLAGGDPWRLRGRAQRRLRGQLFLAPQTPPLPPRQRVVTAVLAARLPAMGLWRSLRSLFYPVDIPGAHAALERFDMAEKLFDRVDRLSGGERQRVGLTRALLAPASLWLIDEPLSALDPTRARQAISTLLAEARARGVTLLMSLHQVEVALENFPRVVGLRDGELVFDLPAGEVTPTLLARLYAQHEHELTSAAQPGSPGTLPAAAPVEMNCR
jgi:phosphonate transport system ATP-binding protein